MPATESAYSELSFRSATAAPVKADEPDAAASARQVGIWLASWAVVVFAIILVGGATRLTESGLSITEWKPVTGIIPPLNEAQWMLEFEKYKRIPQYQLLNAGMTLASFKTIYLWEFWHRIVARLAGLGFVIPLAWFAFRRRIPAFAARRIFLLGLLLAAQAGMGWWMVVSGLSDRTEVSQYRLAAHLTLAFIILAVTVWTAADLMQGYRARGSQLSGWRSRLLPAMFGLVLLASASGALVAGLRAGRIYNTFPLMNGRLMPQEYGMFAPWWRNSLDNPAAVQFNHRVIAIVTFSAALCLWALLRASGHSRLTRRIHLILCAALLQLTLGITTLLLAVPIWLGVAHQGGAALLLVTVVLAWHASASDVSPRDPAPLLSR